MMCKGHLPVLSVFHRTFPFDARTGSSFAYGFMNLPTVTRRSLVKPTANGNEVFVNDKRNAPEQILCLSDRFEEG